MGGGRRGGGAASRLHAAGQPAGGVSRAALTHPAGRAALDLLHPPPPARSAPKALPAPELPAEFGEGESAWTPVEVSAREGVRAMGMPTMDGEEEDAGDKMAGTSFRVPKGVTGAV